MKKQNHFYLLIFIYSQHPHTRQTKGKYAKGKDAIRGTENPLNSELGKMKWETKDKEKYGNENLEEKKKKNRESKERRKRTEFETIY